MFGSIANVCCEVVDVTLAEPPLLGAVRGELDQHAFQAQGRERQVRLDLHEFGKHVLVLQQALRVQLGRALPFAWWNNIKANI